VINQKIIRGWSKDMSVKHLLLILIILCASVSCKNKQDIRQPIEGQKPAKGTSGMVSTAHPIATRIGLDILKSGGNAFDAAVAVAVALNVVEPMNSGIGGYGTILVYDASSGKARFLDSSGKIPINVDSDVFRPPTLGYMENRKGPKAVTTPGN